MRRVLVILLLTSLVAGCSSFGGGRARQDLPEPPDASQYQAEVGVRQLWSQSLGTLPTRAGLALRPAVADGRVYVADTDAVYAYEGDSGKLVWRRELDRSISAGPGVGGNLVVVGTRDGRVVALRSADGQLAWQAALTGEVLAAPAVGAELVVVRVADGRVFGLEAVTGERRWLYEQTVPVLTLRGTSSPLLIDGRLAVAGLDTGKLVALAPQNGRPVWETAIAAPRGRSDIERMVDIDADPVFYRADIYTATYNGRLAAVDAASGRIRWEREASTHAGIAVDSSRVYMTDADQRVWAVDRFSGASVWRQDELRGLRLSGPAVAGEYVLVGDDAGYLNWLAVRDGSLKRRQRIGGAFVAPPLVQDKSIYLLTEEGLTVLRGE